MAGVAACAGRQAFFHVAVAYSGAVKLALAIAVLVYARHHANIRRLLAGTEPRIGQHSSGKA